MSAPSDTLALTRISHRELRNNSAEILRRVAAGELFEITNHGEVVAVLMPPDLPPLERLRIAGGTRRPTHAWIDPWTQPRVKAEISTAEIIADVRGDR